MRIQKKFLMKCINKGGVIMKTLKRNISYNVACSILAANHYGVTNVKAIGKWIVLYNKDRVVARYREETGSLQVI